MRIALVLLALSSPAIPQVVAPRIAAQHIVLPSKALNNPGSGAIPSMFHGGGPARTQLLYDTGDIAVSTAMFRSVQVRPNIIPNWPTTIQLAITMSVSPVAFEAVVSEYQQNRGPNPVVVLSGPVNLPATGTRSLPAPWVPPIVFAMPFAYNGSQGKSLASTSRCRTAAPVALGGCMARRSGTRAPSLATRAGVRTAVVWRPTPCRSLAAVRVSG